MRSKRKRSVNYTAKTPVREEKKKK